MYIAKHFAVFAVSVSALKLQASDEQQNNETQEEALIMQWNANEPNVSQNIRYFIWKSSSVLIGKLRLPIYPQYTIGDSRKFEQNKTHRKKTYQAITQTQNCDQPDVQVTINITR